MSNTTRDANDLARWAGFRFVLVNFFGVTNIDSGEQNAESITCHFDARASDGSHESRPVKIHRENTPEQNMEILFEARRRQAWYQNCRHEQAGIDVEPPNPAEPASAPAS